MSEEEYITFEEATKLLNMKEEDLLDLVASNVLRAYRINREMKFKKSEVADYGTNGGGEAAAVIEAEPVPDTVVSSESIELIDEEESVGAADDLIDMDIDENVPDTGDILALDGSDEEDSMATVAIDDEEPLLQAQTEDLTPALEEEPLVELSDSDSGLGTEEIVFEDDDLTAATAVNDQDATATMIVDAESDLDESEHTQLIDQDELLIEEDKPKTRAGAGHRQGDSKPVSAGSMRTRHAAFHAAAAADKPSALTMVSLIAPAALVIIMIYPALLYVAMLGFGETTHGADSPSTETPKGAPVIIPAFSGPANTAFFKDLWGEPMLIGKADLVEQARIRATMPKAKPAAPAPAPEKTDEAKPADDAKPAEGEPAKEAEKKDETAKPAENAETKPEEVKETKKEEKPEEKPAEKKEEEKPAK